MIYAIKQSNIAACIHVSDQSGRVWDCCYMSDTRPVQVGVSGDDADRENLFRTLPEAVRDAVNKQYAEVFAVPIEKRGDFVATLRGKIQQIEA